MIPPLFVISSWSVPLVDPDVLLTKNLAISPVLPCLTYIAGDVDDLLTYKYPDVEEVVFILANADESLPSNKFESAALALIPK